MVADWFDGREIATAMSILVMSWPLGIALGQVGHASIAEQHGWRLPFQLASLYCGAAGLAILALYRPRKLASPAQPHAAARMTGQDWQLILCAGGAWALLNAAYVVYLSFGPKVLEALGHAPLAAAATTSLASWVMAGSAILCGLFVDRFGHRGLVIGICMLGGMGAFWMLSLPGAGLVASGLFGLLGIAPAGVIMALAGMALRPEVRAFGMGVFFTVYFAAMLAVPPLAGALLDATGQPMAPIWLGIALLAGVVPLVLVFTRVKSGAPRGQDAPLPS
jgi:MFS family permease